MSIGLLPEELKTEILSRLPVKSVIRSMLVCKSWYSLITTTRFISLHLSKARASKLFLRSTGDHGLADRYYTLVKLDEENRELQLQVSFKLEHPFYECDFNVVGSCGGLLCLSFVWRWRTRTAESGELNLPFESLESIIIWNPSIQNQVLLPTPTIEPKKRSTFGFGAAGCDYKVVRIVGSNSTVEVEIYSLNSRTWRRVHLDELFRGRTYFMGQAIVERRLHWIAYDHGEEVDGNIVSRNLISSFDMDKEVFKDVLFPDYLSRKSRVRLSISVVGEALGVFEKDGFFCHVWVMKEYGVVNSWTKLYNIDFSPAKAQLMRQVISVRKNGEVVIQFGFAEKVSVTYDPKTGKIKKDPGTSGLFYVGDYMESLVLLGGDKHAGAERPFIIEFKSLSEGGDVPQLDANQG